MKVLFIEPDNNALGFNLGFAYLSAVLKQHGHEVKVLDFNNKRGGEVKRLQNAAKWKPDMVGASISCYNEKGGINVLKYLKKRTGAKCVMGGGGPTLRAEAIATNNADTIDCVFMGESETTLPKFLDNINNFHNINGIAYYDKEREAYVQNPREEPIKNLDDLPFPDFTSFDSFTGKMPCYPMITSRGCHVDCVFCTNAFLWKRLFRARSVDNIIEEMRYAKKELGTKLIQFYDNEFTLVKDRVREICDRMVKEKFNFKWEMYNGMRADGVDLDLLQRMKKAGCWEITIGVENADAETFKYVEKGEPLSAIENCVKLCQKVGIKIKCFMIIGLMHTTKETDERSLKYIQKLKTQAIWFTAVPYPHTKLYDWVKKNGTMLIDKYEGVVITPNYPPTVYYETSEYPKEERQKMYLKANLRTDSYTFVYDDFWASWPAKYKQVLKVAWDVDRRYLPYYAVHYPYTLARSLFRRLKAGNVTGVSSIMPNIDPKYMKNYIPLKFNENTDLIDENGRIIEDPEGVVVEVPKKAEKIRI